MKDVSGNTDFQFIGESKLKLSFSLSLFFFNFLLHCLTCRILAP